MKKYLVSIRISRELNRVKRLFEAENPAQAIVKANAYIKEKNWSSGQVVALYEKIWDIDPQKM